MRKENEVHGNTSGLKNSVIEQLQTLYEQKVEKGSFFSQEMAEKMAFLTQQTGREIAVYLNRAGEVTDVIIGSGEDVSLPKVSFMRSERALCGVRCFHTHPDGSAMLSRLDETVLKSYRLDAMTAIAVIEGKPAGFTAAFLMEGKIVHTPVTTNPYGEPLYDTMMQAVKDYIFELYEKKGKDRAILVGIEDAALLYDSMGELAQLADTAGASVVAKITQKREGSDNATYVGRGKVKEISQAVQQMEADLCIFDDELSSVQVRNLEEALGLRIVDRATLILDIFAQRAQSSEGKMQVELAQLKYMLPRLTGFNTALSRLGGGIGTRGPGEKKLETDRRHIKRRIFELERNIEGLKAHRQLRRSGRGDIPTVALVGYTNAGKSTMLNRLSGSSVLAEDKLFATLDPVTRSVSTPGGIAFLLVDTVGFINKLPHDLIDAFRSTLEEAVYADVLVHVVDASCSFYTTQMQVVEDVLASLGAGDKPVIVAMNKVDKTAVSDTRNAVAVSAETGQGLNDLLLEIEKTLLAAKYKMEYFIPYTKSAAKAFLHREAKILEEEFSENGVRLVAMVDQRIDNLMRKQLQ
ncbi:MAG: GTPase HflX [Christensenellales bacterium]